MTKKKDSAEKAIRDIRRASRRGYSAEEEIRIVRSQVRSLLQGGPAEETVLGDDAMESALATHDWMLASTYLDALPENVHLASAWGKIGGGFSGAILSGYMCATDLLRKA